MSEKKQCYNTTPSWTELSERSEEIKIAHQSKPIQCDVMLTRSVERHTFIEQPMVYDAAAFQPKKKQYPVRERDSINVKVRQSAALPRPRASGSEAAEQGAKLD